MLSTDIEYPLYMPEDQRLSTQRRDGTESILWVSHCQGNWTNLQKFALQYGFKAIVHLGNFGLFDHSSLERMNEMQLYGLWNTYGNQQEPSSVKEVTTWLNNLLDNGLLQEVEAYLTGRLTLSVPVYIVPGPLDDILMIKRLQSNPLLNLRIVHHSQLIEIGHVKFRLILVPSSFQWLEEEKQVSSSMGRILFNDFESLFDQFDQSSGELKVLVHSAPIVTDLICRIAKHCKADYLYSTDSMLQLQKLTENNCRSLMDPEYFKATLLSAFKQQEIETKSFAKLNRIFSLWERNADGTGYMITLPHWDQGHVVFNVTNLTVSHTMVSAGPNMNRRMAEQLGMALNSIQMNGNSAEWDQSKSRASPIVKTPAAHSRSASIPQQIGTWETSSNLSETSSEMPSGEMGMTVWVGNLPEDVTEQDLRQFFRSVPILRIRLTAHRPDKRPCAFIDVPDTTALENALRLGGERLHGSRLKVEYDPCRLKKEYRSKPRTSPNSPATKGKKKEESACWPIKEASEPTTPSWDSPPRKDSTRFSTGADWDRPSQVTTTGKGWDNKEELEKKPVCWKPVSGWKSARVEENKAVIHSPTTWKPLNDGWPLNAPFHRSNSAPLVKSASNPNLPMEWRLPFSQQTSPKNEAVEDKWKAPGFESQAVKSTINSKTWNPMEPDKLWNHSHWSAGGLSGWPQ